MRTVANWLASDGVPVWAWTAWMTLWLAVIRAAYWPSPVTRCDSCSEPYPMRAMSLVRLRGGTVVHRCDECNEFAALLREAARIVHASEAPAHAD